ncbi:MAG: AAA family ATPase [Sphingomonas fennica]
MFSLAPFVQAANDVAEKLTGTAAAVAILPVPTGAEKSDVSDWLANGGSAFELPRKAEEALTKPDETFPIADLEAWGRTTPVAKAFVMAPFVPPDEVVVVTGDGGTNKSTLALQISACAAANRPMLGMNVVPGPSLYITAEDDDRENHCVSARSPPRSARR